MAVATPISATRFVRSLLLAAALLAAPAASFAAVLLTVNIAPPPLPVYVQPVVPAPGFIWTPGYWAYSDEGYFWVPGTWVRAPYVGALWTPGWWGWGAATWAWHPGYWGPHVGYYGGINYGFGYFGTGYRGGYWNNRGFTYNSAVTNVNVTTIHNVYREPWTGTVSHVSYNGGAGGLVARPSADERLAERDRHVGATPVQLQHEHFASTNRAQFASANHGLPGITATHRAAAFNAPNSALNHRGAPAGAALNGSTLRQNSAHGGAPGNQAAVEHRAVRTQKMEHAQAIGRPPSTGQPAGMGHPQNVEHAKIQQHENRGGKEAHEEDHHR